MEDSDDLVPDPDMRGFLDVTNRAWVNIDPVVFTMFVKHLTVLTLDISFNHLYEIPNEIGDLLVLREIRASFNKLTTISPEIGKLKRLRRLILNNNRLISIPETIGRLDSLEELVLSENKLEEIPKSIADISQLRQLRLQTNCLKTIPVEFADTPFLELIDCSNNADFNLVPLQYAGDTNSILFICRAHRDYRMKMDEMSQANSDLTKHTLFLEKEGNIIKDLVDEQKEMTEIFRKNVTKSKLKKLDDVRSGAATETVKIKNPNADMDICCIM